MYSQSKIRLKRSVHFSKEQLKELDYLMKELGENLNRVVGRAITFYYLAIKNRKKS